MTNEAPDLARAFTQIMRAAADVRKSFRRKARAALIQNLQATTGITANAYIVLEACGAEPANWESIEDAIAAEFELDPSLAGRLWANQDWPRPFWLVLRDELKQVAFRRGEGAEGALAVDRAKDVYAFAAEKKLLGLAFSGGGIRSATFNLGVLQALAETGLLPHVDILSTVSGGGYIGAFFTSWMQRDGLRATDFQQRLSPEASRDPDDPKQKPIRFLRQFSNYLTPKLGTFSLDTWTLVAIYIRNVLLNQITLLASLGALLMLPRLAGVLPTVQSRDTAWILVATALLVMSVVSVAVNLRSVVKAGKGLAHGGLPSQIHVTCIFPLLLAALVSSQVFCNHINDWPTFNGLSQPAFFWPSFLFFTVLSLIISLVGGFWHCFRNRLAGNSVVQALLLLALITAVTALTGTALLRGYVVLMQAFKHGHPGGFWHALVWGPPVLLNVIAFTAVLQVGLMGIDFPDAGREWLSRLRATTTVYTFFWLALFCAAIYGPLLVAKLGLGATGIGMAWIGTTAASVMAGSSSQSGESKEGAPTFSKMDLLARIGPPVFLAGFVVVVSYAIHLLLAHDALNGNYSFRNQVATHWWVLNGPKLFNRGDWVLAAPLSLFGVLLGVALIFSWRVDINEFSMHHFYKNRLVRCYLGASNENRKPNPFIGFDDNDEIRLANLRQSQSAGGYKGPYHIVNATLNLSCGGQLAWQERRAASFVFTPCYAGFDLPPDSDHPGDKNGVGRLRFCAYRPTETYAYKGGISLGTAISISGAAADPNQGFHTSPAVAFLMTVFDVRLGWWLGNPRKDLESKLSSPRIGFAALVSSLFGLSTDRSNFVSLSDGGHFENMGIYELVRRRCKYIVLCDAEQDGNYTFSGLGMAIRKCRVDFGAEIDIDPGRIKPSGADRTSDVHCAVGSIRYSDGEEGVLVYIKSSLSGDEPEDVLQYAAAKPAFPHESTANQWFTESQFESYRKLGHHAAMCALEPARKWSDWDPASNNVTPLFDSLNNHWYPLNPALLAHSGTHTRGLKDLFNTIRNSVVLQSLGGELFPGGGFQAQPGDPVAEYFFCMTLLQLVEDVYVDFGLERSEWRDDPRIGGWMTIFRTWRKIPRVVETWAAGRRTFRKDFQQFWDDLEEAPVASEGS